MALSAAERQRRYRERHKNDPAFKARVRVAKQRDYAKRRTQVLAANRRWAVENRDKTRAIWKRFYRNHLESERQRTLNKSPEERRMTRERYRRNNLLEYAAKEGRRRARKRETAIGPVDYEAIVRAANGICAICNEAVVDTPAHIDHIVPLARGGTHTQDNLQFTHARCNLLKGVKTLKVG